MTALAKRFPDRDEIADVRAEAEPLEPGQEAETKRRLAGRIMARRDMGKIVFLDLVDRSGRIQLLCPVDRTGTVDVLSLLRKSRSPPPDTFHGATDADTRYRQRYLDLLMNEDSRRETMLRA